MAEGSIVWAVMGTCVVLLSICTLVFEEGRHHRLNDVVAFFLHCWLGRVFALACWAEVGFHLFAQRP